MRYTVYILLLISFISCNRHKTDCALYVDDLKDNSKVFVVDSSNYQILDRGLDSIKGGAYFFYKNKRLKSYKFFASKQGYTYSEEYDENGNLVRKNGKPIVYQNIKEINKDSMFITYYFYAYNKIYSVPKISVNGSNKINLKLIEDTLYSNMLSGSIGFNAGGSQFVNIYLEVKCTDKCSAQTELLTDTTMLSMYPDINIMSNGLQWFVK